MHGIERASACQEPRIIIVIIALTAAYSWPPTRCLVLVRMHVRVGKKNLRMIDRVELIFFFPLLPRIVEVASPCSFSKESEGRRTGDRPCSMPSARRVPRGACEWAELGAPVRDHVSDEHP